MANGTSVPMQTPRHLPVMWKEVMDGLHLKPDGRYLDGTFGRGGHAAACSMRLVRMVTCC